MLNIQQILSGKCLSQLLMTLLICGMLAGCPNDKNKKDNPPPSTDSTEEADDDPGSALDCDAECDRSPTPGDLLAIQIAAGSCVANALLGGALSPALQGEGESEGEIRGGFCAGSLADPHLVTFDGNRYDFQAVGEFVLFEIPAEPQITLQVRTQSMRAFEESPFKSCVRGVSINTAIATLLGGHRISIDASRDHPLFIDGEPATVPEDGMSYDDGSHLFASEEDGQYVLIWPDETAALVQIRPSDQRFMDIQISPAQERSAQTTGLFGSANEDASDDYQRRDGSIIAQPLSFETLYRNFAESWRITEAESLFDYPAGKGHADFQDHAAPRVIAGIDDLPVEAVAAARMQCEDAGVTEGQLDNCTLDTVCDPEGSFIESAAQGLEGTQDSDLVLPTSIFFLPTPDPLKEITIDNLHAYVAHDAVQAINIADPSNAQLLTASGPIGGTKNMQSAGHLVYSTGGGVGLQVFDFSNPDAPFLLGEVTTPGDSVGLDVDILGDFAYLTYVNNSDSDGGLAIVDISQPETPAIVGQVVITNVTNNGGAVAVNGSYAFIQSLQGSPGTLHVVDVSDVTSPTVVGSVAAGGLGSRIDTSGKHVYIISLISDELTVVDVSSPTAPVEVAKLPWRLPDSDSGNATDLVLSGNKALITDTLSRFNPDTNVLEFLSGLQAVDISDPENPVRGKRVETDGAEGTQRLDIFGSFAYVTTDGGLWIVGLGNFAD